MDYEYLLERENDLVDGLATIQRYFRNGTIYNEDKKCEVEEILTRLEICPDDCAKANSEKCCGMWERLKALKEEKGEILGLLKEWQDAHKELQAEHEKWITTTLEENEDFLGEVRKSGWKAGREEESARTIQVEEELKALKAENERLKADLASAITKKPRKPKAKPVFSCIQAVSAPAPEINEKGVRRFFVSKAAAAEEPVYADKPEE